DARRHGVTVLRPDVNASDVEATVERLPADRAGGDHQGARTGSNPMVGGGVRVDTAFGPEPDLGLAVRLGLSSVRGLGKDAAERVVAARGTPGEGRAFRDLRVLV